MHCKYMSLVRLGAAVDVVELTQLYTHKGGRVFVTVLTVLYPFSCSQRGTEHSRADAYRVASDEHTHS